MGDDAAALAAVEVLHAHGTVIEVTPRPAPTIRRIGEIHAALDGMRDERGEVVSLFFSSDLMVGAVVVRTAAEHIELVRRAMAVFGSDVVVDDGDHRFALL